MAHDDCGVADLLGHETRLPLPEDEEHVVAAAARVPKRERVPNVRDRLFHGRAQVSAPRDTLIEEEGHVEEARARRVERAGKVIMHQVRVEVRLC